MVKKKNNELTEKSQPPCYEKQITKGTFKILINLRLGLSVQGLARGTAHNFNSLRSEGT